MFRRIALATLAAAALAAVTTPAALAQWPGSNWQDNRGNRDRDRGGENEEVPLTKIQKDLRERFGGQMLDAKKQGSTYIVSWVDGSGRRMTIDVDARSGRVLSVR